MWYHLQECVVGFLYLLAPFLLDLQQVHLQTLLDLPRLLLSSSFLCTQPGNLHTHTHTHLMYHSNTIKNFIPQSWISSCWSS